MRRFVEKQNHFGLKPRREHNAGTVHPISRFQKGKQQWQELFCGQMYLEISFQGTKCEGCFTVTNWKIDTRQSSIFYFFLITNFSDFLQEWELKQGNVGNVMYLWHLLVAGWAELASCDLDSCYTTWGCIETLYTKEESPGLPSAVHTNMFWWWCTIALFHKRKKNWDWLFFFFCRFSPLRLNKGWLAAATQLTTCTLK